MGTNWRPSLLANMYLYSYEVEFIQIVLWANKTKTICTSAQIHVQVHVYKELPLMCTCMSIMFYSFIIQTLRIVLFLLTLSIAVYGKQLRVQPHAFCLVRPQVRLHAIKVYNPMRFKCTVSCNLRARIHAI